MRQQIHYAASGDGLRLAWAELGRGRPLVKAATWLTHLQYDQESPVWAHWLRFLGANFRYIRYDERGCGMSDRDATELSLASWVDDLAHVVDAARVERPFVLLGISQGAATAIRYAVRHPERVSHLVLYGGYAIGGNRADDPERRALFKAVMEVAGLGWGSDNPAFRQMFTTRFLPSGTPAQIEWISELCRRTTSQESAIRLLRARGEVDVRDLLDLVRVPTLVVHCDGDQIAPLSQGRMLASRIPGASFVQLDSNNHVLLEHEPAWRDFQEAVLGFTGVATGTGEAAPVADLTQREQAALHLLCEGQSNAQIAWQLGVAEKTVRNHLSNLYRKLGVRSRAEAIVRAHRHAGQGG
ncbi:MAG TPA: alpha/beta fold hydrolase [Xanthomonadaceae bacterium]|nr:alpha/beta fold hydrolase [Xanthomonadaceae bacterium]